MGKKRLTDEERKQRACERSKRYYQDNKEAELERRKKWREANREAVCEYQKQYYEVNKDDVKEKSRQRYESNREKRKIQSRIWYESHKVERQEHSRRKNKEWYLNNRERAALLGRLRNTRLERQIPPWCEEEQVRLVYEKCAELNERYNLTGPDKLTVDHIVPIQGKNVTGLHCWHNLQILCLSMNSGKKNKYETDY